jgi:large subunit GTPase 1
LTQALETTVLNLPYRLQWANYFDEQKVDYAFFSALNATALQEARREALAAAQREEALLNEPESSGDELEDPGIAEGSSDDDSGSESEYSYEEYMSADEEDDGTQDPRTKVLSVLELEDLFTTKAPSLSRKYRLIQTREQRLKNYISVFKDGKGKAPEKLTVGLVGYPNVGKSSTINSLLGEKKVSVSSTPGKTKHFQTINLSEEIILCDCPGLVFPQFATTKAALVCDGVLPIDQMREYIGPVGLVVKRVPKEVLNAAYNITIPVETTDDGKEVPITASDLLIAHASE